MLVTLMIEALSSSETSLLTRATRCNIPEDDILHSHFCENLKSYNRTEWFGWILFEDKNRHRPEKNMKWNDCGRGGEIQGLSVQWQCKAEFSLKGKE
jgi:hypothetical protein